MPHPLRSLVRAAPVVLLSLLHAAAPGRATAQAAPANTTAAASAASDTTSAPAVSPRPTGAATGAAAPESVRVGIYVRDVYAVDLKSGTYEVDFDLWIEWDGKIDPTGFVILNGKRDEQEKVASVTGSDEHSALYRCQFLFHQALDRHAYPLDAHRLTIQVEDGQHTARELVYVPDRRWKTIDPAVRIPGWAIGRPTATTSLHLYPAEPGAALSADQVQEYSHFEVGIPLTRPDAGIFYKSFLVLFISVAVGLLAPMLTVPQMEARLGLGLASVFGVVSSYVVASGNLPESGELTLTDKLHIAGMACVFLSILASVAFYRLEGRMDLARLERTDRNLGIATAAGYVLIVVVLCLVR
ncbi:MAG TPA: hypothetical protein VFH27_12235 [Longimicrobiaceae bacterium]|nr:hypothetical protein [Longimicrobiaceae bacterium]